MRIDLPDDKFSAGVDRSCAEVLFVVADCKIADFWRRGEDVVDIHSEEILLKTYSRIALRILFALFVFIIIVQVTCEHDQAAGRIYNSFIRIVE